MTESPTDGPTLVRRAVLALLGIELVLVVMDLIFAFAKVVDLRLVQRLWNTAREDSFATWFASSQALLVALALLGLALTRRAAGSRGALGWGLLAAFFAAVSADDALSIHERAGGALRRGLFADGASWFPSYSWQLMFGPLLVVIALAMIAFLARNLAPHLRLWIVAGLAMAAFAVGMDFVEGLDGAFDRIAAALHLSPYTVSHLSKVTEELLEMAGTTMFFGAFALQLAEELRDLRGGHGTLL